MQELIGQIAATVIGGVIILILAVIAWRGQNHATSAVQYSAGKEGILDFAQVMEEDLSNMGAGLKNATLADSSKHGGFADATAFDTSSTVREFRFYSWTDRLTDDNYATDTDAVLVRYQWSQTGTVQVLNPLTQVLETKPTYIIERAVDSGAGFEPAGSSIETLTEVSFDFFDEFGNPENVGTAAGMRDVRAMDVTLRAVTPLGGGTGFVDASDPAQRGEIEETRWNRVIRPHNLTRASL